MARLVDAQLRVDQVPDKPGRRLLRVSYEREIAAGDLSSGGELVERVLIRSEDLHDSPTAATALAIEIERADSVAGPGTVHREVSQEVRRTDLDVQQDMWRTDHGGGVEAIAELPDHLVAEITLSIDGRSVATAITPIVTGSWGAVGSD